jgi:hypothetical protein
MVLITKPAMINPISIQERLLRPIWIFCLLRPHDHTVVAMQTTYPGGPLQMYATFDYFFVSALDDTAKRGLFIKTLF